MCRKDNIFLLKIYPQGCISEPPHKKSLFECKNTIHGLDISCAFCPPVIRVENLDMPHLLSNKYVNPVGKVVSRIT